MSKVQFGLSNAYYAVINPETGKYGAPVHMEGAESISISNAGNDSDIIYADNIEYFKRSSQSGISGDLQMAKFPKSFYTDVLGQKAETGGGVSAGPSDVAKKFALMFELSTDLGGKRVCWFNCSATVPTYTASTNTDSLSEASETSTITGTNAVINGENKVTYSCETGDDNYATFFNAVPLVTA